MDSTEGVLRLTRVRDLATSGRALEIRLRSQLSLSDVARPIGVSHVTIYRWEKGERLPTGPAADRWLALLDALDRLQEAKAG